MEKHIITWSYWLGIVCALLAFLTRALNAEGLNSLELFTKGNPIGYHSFLDGAVLFFLIAIASGSYRSSQSRQ